MTISHQANANIQWKHVHDVVIGKKRLISIDFHLGFIFQGNIRTQLDENLGEIDGQNLSLSLITSSLIRKSVDNRTFYHFIVAWDSSLHNSILLNRCTTNGISVYVTISSYLDIESVTQPVILSKDLSLILNPRAVDPASRFCSSLKNFFLPISPTSRSSFLVSIPELTSSISSVYQLKFRQSKQCFSRSDRSVTRKVIDTSNIYVRGEEMLNGWRPRRDSLIIEHRTTLENFDRIRCVRCFFRHLNFQKKKFFVLGRTDETYFES